MKTKNLKGIVAYSVICACCISTASTVSANSISVNNRPLELKSESYIKNGSTMVPLRVISEALKANVSYDSQAKAAKVSKGGVDIVVTVDSYQAKVGGKITAMQESPEIKNGTLMVPLRFIAQALSCEISWDDATKTVMLTTQDGLETFTLTSQLPAEQKSQSEIYTASGLAPDGKTAVRKTNMPSSYAYFRYIQADVPNWAYDAVYKSWSNNIIASNKKGESRYPNNPDLTKVAYTPVDLQKEDLYGTQFGEAFWRSIVDQGGWKESTLPNDKDNNVDGSEDDIMTQEDMFTNLVKQTTNVNYLKDTKDAYAISTGNYIHIGSIDPQGKTPSVSTCNGYMLAQMKANVNNKLITHSEFKVMKEAMWMPSDGNMISVYVPVYIKITCENFEPGKEGWKQFPFAAAAMPADATEDSSKFPDISKGETWEGVWQVQLMCDPASKVYKVMAFDGNIALQLSPDFNMYDGVKPELDKTTADKLYNIGTLATPELVKRH